MQSQDYKKRLKLQLIIILSIAVMSCGVPSVPTALSSLLERESIRVGTVYGAGTFYNLKDPNAKFAVQVQKPN